MSDDGREQQYTGGQIAEMDNYDSCMRGLIAINFNEVDEAAIVKVKIQCLEENQRTQINYNHGARNASDALAAVTAVNDAALRQIIQQVQRDFQEQMTRVTKEYDHR